ncbi:hypothetical protein V7152_04270, partial [Neobacillus drentensis]
MSIVSFISTTLQHKILTHKNRFCEKQTVDTEFFDWSGRCEILENAIAFPSCGDYSMELIQCPAGAAGQVRSHRRKAPRRLTARPAESEHPGAEIN